MPTYPKFRSEFIQIKFKKNEEDLIWCRHVKAEGIRRLLGFGATPKLPVRVRGSWADSRLWRLAMEEGKKRRQPRRRGRSAWPWWPVAAPGARRPCLVVPPPQCGDADAGC